MRYEDLAHLSTEALIDIKETVSQALEARNIEMLNVALSELTAVINKWYEKGVSFYILDNADCEIPIYSREVRVRREWI